MIFDKKLQQTVDKARDLALARGTIYFEAIIDEGIVECPNFESGAVQKAVDQCFRSFVDELQTLFHIEQTGGKVANINKAAMRFEECLAASCKKA